MEGSQPTVTEAGILSRLRRGTIEVFFLHGIGAVLLFSMHALLGRVAGASSYGIFSYALALVNVLAVIVPLGWQSAIIRFVSQYREQREWGLLRGSVTRSYQITALSAVVAALVLLGLSFLGSIPPDLSASLRFAALLLPVLAFVGLRRKTLQGLQKAKLSVLPEDIVVPILVIAGVWILSVGTAADIALIYAAAALCAFLLGNYWLWRNMPPESRGIKSEFRTRAWMAISLPMVFGGFSQIIMNRIDILLLGSLLGSASVGVYSAAVRIATLNTFVLVAVATMVTPMIASAFHGGRTAQVRTLLRQAMLLGAIGGIPLFLVMFFFPGLLLGFFGEEFARNAHLLQILAVGQLVNAITGPVGYVLLMAGRERAFALTTAVVAVGSVGGNLVVIPIYGATGAAFVTATSVIVLNVWQYLLSRRMS